MDAKGLTPRINFVTLGVHDMKMMRAFYERLGFVASSASNEGVTFFDANGIVLGLFGYKELAEDAHVDVADPSPFHGFSLAWNATSEKHADEIMAHALRAGAVPLKMPEKVFWGGYSGYFKDPEHNLWEVAFNPFMTFDDSARVKLP
jgi:uncharacterized protein